MRASTPENLHAGVHVFDRKGRSLCFAKCLHPVAFNDTKAAREHGRVRARYKRSLNRAAQDRARMEDLQDTYGVEPVAAGPGAKLKVVELVHPEQQAADAQATTERDEREDRFARAALGQLNRN